MVKKKNAVRTDSKRARLQTGETQRDNGTYIYRWTSQDGNRHAIYAPTLKELREKEAQVMIDQNDGLKPDAKSMTVNSVYELWKDIKRGVKDSTMKNYMYMYETFVMPTFGRKRITTVKKSDVRQFYNHLVDDNIMQISTVDGIHNILHQVFQVAVDDDLIRNNPTDNSLRELRLTHTTDEWRRKALTIEQQNLFFDYLQNTPQYLHWYPIFFIMANTGMRVGEITGLRWCDVDLENGTLSVNHTMVYYDHRDGQGCYYSVNSPKTKAGERDIPMTSKVREAFLMQKEFQEASDTKRDFSVDGYKDFVFLNRDGRVYNQNHLNKAIRRIMRDCNSAILDKHSGKDEPILVPYFSCHVLRHTFATRLCESGISLKVVQEILGHADVKTTLSIYVSVTEEFKKREMSAFDNYLATGERKDSAIG